MKRTTRRKVSTVSLIALLIYTGCIIFFMLFSDRLGRTAGYDTYHYNLKPFTEIRRFITYRDAVSTSSFLLNLLGNTLVFFPIGFLIPLLKRRYIGLFRIIFYAFILSLTLEILQLITKVGVFDVDDLLMNTAGAAMGWIIYQFFNLIYRIRRWRLNRMADRAQRRNRKRKTGRFE